MLLLPLTRATPNGVARALFFTLLVATLFASVPPRLTAQTQPSAVAVAPPVIGRYAAEAIRPTPDLRVTDNGLAVNGVIPEHLFDQPVSRVLSARDGSHLAVQRCVSARARADCHVLWLERAQSVEIPYQFDLPLPSIAISPQGAIAWSQPATGEWGILDADGQPVAAGRFGDEGVWYERSVLLEWDASGTQVLVTREILPATHEALETGSMPPDEPGKTGNLETWLLTADGSVVLHQRLPGRALGAAGMDAAASVARIETYEPYGTSRLGVELALQGMGKAVMRSAPPAIVPAEQYAQGHYVRFDPAPPMRTQAVQYPWPVTPFSSSQRITGTFGEYRGPSSPHFHNGTDIPKADGSNVYPVLNARVSTVAPGGANAYVRADNNVYVHINPATGLSVGQAVTQGQTVLGTIVGGQGHVHLSEGPPGAYINALRQGGGLNPFVDTFAPEISQIQFKLEGTGQALSPGGLTATVRILFRVEEPSVGPGSSASGRNNGAYKVGYRVWNQARTEIVHSPTSDGIVYQFDTIPSNAYVNNVFDAAQASTSSHVYIITNRVTSTLGWDTSALPDGDYVVELFAEDTRQNATSAFVEVSITQRDIVPPPPPTWTTVQSTAAGAHFTWQGVDADDLAGYRLLATSGTSLAEVAPEAVLTAQRVDYASAISVDAPAYYVLRAVDNQPVPNVSTDTDRYGTWRTPDKPRVLIVDGFDRSSASWKSSIHDFAALYGGMLAVSEYGFDTAANEAVVAGHVALSDYALVVWFLGDESTADETFSDDEQRLLRAYVASGGYLVASGSEIGWDLGAQGSASDQAFLREVLKLSYLGDDSGSLTVSGTSGSLFDGLRNVAYGSRPYVEDYPDYFAAQPDARVVLTYGNDRAAGVLFEGTIPGGSAPAKVLTVGFPLETISQAGFQNLLMNRVLTHFFPPSTSAASVATAFVLGQPYPNPARDWVRIPVLGVPHSADGAVDWEVVNLLGRTVRSGTLSSQDLILDLNDLAAGVYFFRAGATVRRMVKQ
jgi:hypothetical protein